MATLTPNYNLEKPEASDEFKDFRASYNGNMDIIDQALEEAGANLAEFYDDTATYSVGDYVVYEGILYKCDTAVTVAETFDPTKWTQVAITDEMGGGGGVDELNDLSDVTISSATNLQALVYDNITQKWKNSYPNGVLSKNGLTTFKFDATLTDTEDVEYYGTLTYKGSGVWEFGATEPLFKVVNGELCQVYDDGN